MQWMSRIPVSAPDHVLATLSTIADVRKAVMDQQAVDWMRFLKMRSSELRRGGKLLTAIPGRTAEESGWEWLGGEFWNSIVDLRESGMISAEEQLRITLPTAPRSLEATRAPFGQNGLFEGLELEHTEIFKVPDPCWADFQRTGDKQSLGQFHANGTRAWSGPTIMALLDPNRDRVAIVDALFARLAERLAIAPRPHEPYLVVAVLSKRR
jgi:cyclopropane-fatty-acyl-phospholipid synthase